LSDGNDTKTREQLLAEIEALQKQLGKRDGDQPESTASAPVFSGPITRRESLVSWVAPVILSLPVVQGLGMVLKPGTAYAGSDDSVPLPTFHAPTFHAPTITPRPAPTLHAPTFHAPTFHAPTLAPPTAAATSAPTRAGRCIVTPTVAPTLGMASAPDARPTPAGVIALGSARALSRARVGT
jgi:hypothetical protein